MMKRIRPLMQWIGNRNHGFWSLIVSMFAISLTIFNMYMNSLQLEFSVLHPIRTIVVQNSARFNGIIAARDYHAVDTTMPTGEYAELSRLYSKIRNSYIVVSPYIKDHRRRNIDNILNRIEHPATKVKDVPLIGMRHVILEIQEALFDTGAYSWVNVVDVLPSDTEATSE